MQNGILILLSVLSFSANQIMTRLFQTKLQKSAGSIHLYQAIFTLVASLAYFTLAFATGVTFSPHILIPSALFGICFSGAILFSAACMKMGYMSLSSVIINLSLILPVMFSWVVMDEPIELVSVIGLMLIIVTLVLSALSAGGGNDGGKSLKKWLVFVLIAFVCNGCSAIVQKQYKSSYGEADLMMFMGFAYLVSSIIFWIYTAGGDWRNKLPFSEQIKNPQLLPIIVLVSGLGSFLGNGLLGYLCDKVNGGVLYPCINGGLSIVVAISSFVIFKEKLNAKKVAAICTGIVAIVLLNL